MRHLIFGSDTIIGTSILRVLISMGNQDIVCCNPDGSVPNDVPSSDFSLYQADIRSIRNLNSLIQEDDIIYNCQFYNSEGALKKEIEDIHIEGLRKILFIANKNKAKRIISYLPQNITWKHVDNAVEETKIKPTSQLQSINQEILKLSDLYIQNQNYLKNDNYQKIFDNDEKLDETENNEEVVENDSKDNNLQTGPSLQSSENMDPTEPKPFTGPSLTGPTLTGATTGPSLGADTPASTGPTLSGPSAPDTSIESMDSDTDTNELSIEDDSENNNKEIQNEEIKPEMATPEEQRVPLNIAKIARLFGPFDTQITEWICRGIRLQRISVVGKIRLPISWINPVDAGRAMIMMGDDKVPSGVYNVNGFNASPLEILEMMDNVNHSSLKLNHNNYPIAWLKYRLNILLFSIKVHKRIDYSLFLLNRQQLYNDSKARKEWNWSARFTLEKTCKDALTWYVNHLL